MTHFYVVLNLQSNLHDLYTTVRVGLLRNTNINSLNIFLTRIVRPTRVAGQPSMQYAKNTYSSMVVKRVGLKYVSNCFVNGCHIQVMTRPTPTLINVKWKWMS